MSVFQSAKELLQYTKYNPEVVTDEKLFQLIGKLDKALYTHEQSVKKHHVVRKVRVISEFECTSEGEKRKLLLVKGDKCSIIDVDRTHILLQTEDISQKIIKLPLSTEGYKWEYI